MYYCLQLMEMGFDRPSVMEALRYANGLEGATEWLLTHSAVSEEDQLIQAITMSLESSTPGQDSNDDNQAEAEVRPKCRSFAVGQPLCFPDNVTAPTPMLCALLGVKAR